MIFLIGLLGAASFWVPIIAIFAFFRVGPNLPLANTFSLAFSLICVLILRRRPNPPQWSAWMLVGIYFLGPFLLGVANTFSGGGFAYLQNWNGLGWLLFASIFSPMLLFLAGGSGLLPALLSITACILFFMVKDSRNSGGTIRN